MCYCDCSYLIGYGENQISEGGDFLRFTGMTKIPTISFCWPKFYPNDRGPKKPSSVNETAPSLILISENLYVRSTVINNIFQLYAFLVNVLEVYVKETLVDHYYGRTKPKKTGPMHWQL